MTMTVTIQSHLRERITSCSFCLLFYSVLQCLLIRFGSLKEESDSSNKQSDTFGYVRYLWDVWATRHISDSTDG